MERRSLPCRAFIHPVIEPRIFDAEWFKVAGYFDRAGQQVDDGRFRQIADAMALLHCQVPVHLQMEFDENSAARVSRP